MMKPAEEKAFEDLFKLHYNALCCFANRIVKNSAVAEDIASDAFTDFWFKYKDEPGRIINIRAYLFGSVRNHCLLFLKASKRQDVVFHEYNYLTDNVDQESPVTGILVDICVTRILEHLEKLPHGYQNIFKLYYQQQLTLTEIANYLQVSIGSVKKQKHNAKNQLRRMIMAEELLAV